MLLSREVRFSLGSRLDQPVTNSWGGWPSATGIQPYVVLCARVTGDPDPITGYLCNITVIDELIRDRAIPMVCCLWNERPNVTGEQLIRAVAVDLLNNPPLGTWWADWQLKVTPFLSYATTAGAPHMVDIEQSFEFSAAHRLHCPTMSDEENRRVFGKCDNPNGHGHNYSLEVTVTGEPSPSTGVLMPVESLENIVKQFVIDRLDHKHLNRDCPEFASVNPSVENIARTIWGMLEGRLGPARLKRVRVWETPKTCAEYEGPQG